MANVSVAANLMNSSSSQMEMIRRLNMEKFVSLMPVVVYTVTLMVIGVLGNTLCIYIFGFRWRETSLKYYLLCLGIVDFVNTVVTMPTEVLILRNLYYFDDGILCRMSRFTNYVMSNTSSAVYLVIAVDRYIRVCRPEKNPISSQDSKMACCLSFLFGIALSWPSLLIYGSTHLAIPSHNVTGIICSVTEKYDNTLHSIVFFSVMWLAFIIITLILIVLYLLMGRGIIVSKKMANKLSRERTASIKSCQSSKEKVNFAKDDDFSIITSPNKETDNVSSNDDVLKSTEKESPRKDGVSHASAQSDVSIVKKLSDRIFAIIENSSLSWTKNNSFLVTKVPEKMDSLRQNSSVPSLESGNTFLNKFRKRKRIPRKKKDSLTSEDDNFASRTNLHAVTSDSESLTSLSESTSESDSSDDSFYSVKQSCQNLKKQKAGVYGSSVIGPSSVTAQSQSKTDVYYDADACLDSRSRSRSRTRPDIKRASDEEVVRQHFTSSLKRIPSSIASQASRIASRILSFTPHPSRTTLMLFALTLVFVLSLLPSLVVSAVRFQTGPEFFFAKLSEEQQLMFHFFVRSHLVNCSSNVVVYAAFSYEFRRKCARLFRRRQRVARSVSFCESITTEA